MLRSGTSIDPTRGRASFATRAEEWQDSRQHLGVRSKETTRFLFDSYVIPLLGRFPIAVISATDVERVLTAMTVRGLATATRRACRPSPPGARLRRPRPANFLQRRLLEPAPAGHDETRTALVDSRVAIDDGSGPRATCGARPPSAPTGQASGPSSSSTSSYVPHLTRAGSVPGTARSLLSRPGASLELPNDAHLPAGSATGFMSAGDDGEYYLRDSLGLDPAKNFGCERGILADPCRFRDAVEGADDAKVLHESKVGYVTGWFAQKQVLKDVAIRDHSDGEVDILWHFFPSARTGKIGTSTSFLDLLDYCGIPYVIHLPK